MLYLIEKDMSRRKTSGAWGSWTQCVAEWREERARARCVPQSTNVVMVMVMGSIYLRHQHSDRDPDPNSNPVYQAPSPVSACRNPHTAQHRRPQQKA